MSIATDKAAGRWSASGRGLTAILDFAASSHARAIAVLLTTALLCFLPGFFAIPAIDRDEARFAQATKQMIESGDYIDIRFQDEARHKKPVGIYWLQAGVVKLASALGYPQSLTTIWLYRVPSLTGALGAVLLTYWTALAFVSRRAAVLAGLMMASCPLLVIERLIAKTDAMLLLTVLAAMGAMARAYVGSRLDAGEAPGGWRIAAIFWTALAGGVLLKGPLIVMVVGLAALALVLVDRSARWLLSLRPIAGVAWFALLVLPWFVAIIGRSGDAFLAQSFGQDLLGKVFAGQESHGSPPGYYLALFWITFWPGATLAALAAPAIWAKRREPGPKFLLAWLIPTWLLLELTMTKLPHYVLPLYPAVAILIAGAIDARMLSKRPVLAWGAIWWFLVAVLIGVGGILALALIGRQFAPLACLLLAAAAVMGFWAWRSYETDGAEHALLRGIAASALIAVAIFGVVVPSLPQLFPSRTLADILAESGCPQPLTATVGYQEPSLIFLAGTRTRLTDAAGAAEFLRGGECRFAFVESGHEKSFAQRAEAIGLRYTAGPSVEGINISKGRPVTIAVFRSRGQS
jgi:4-amino-4-deoxy-L-arabinose transferase-like glycosyltransferase